MYQVINYVLEDILYYENTPLLNYRINYPHFEPEGIIRINRYYAAKAQEFMKYSRDVLFKQAAGQYQYAKMNHYPVMAYEAIMVYNVTYNSDRILSVYYEQYTYTGGAHGSTVRFSDTWDVSAGKRMELKDFFPAGTDYRRGILAEINRQIAEQSVESGRNGGGNYFDTYRQDTADHFKDTDFYVVPEGLMIYFQQYDIAPYSSGIPQFLIAFGQLS